MAATEVRGNAMPCWRFLIPPPRNAWAEAALRKRYALEATVGVRATASSRFKSRMISNTHLEHSFRSRHPPHKGEG